MTKRSATIKRKTKETEIELTLHLDNPSNTKINTGIPFLDHMLDLFAKHGLFGLEIKAKGDTEIDDHHTAEDVGICLGQAFRKAISQGEGIERYASANIPMDEALCEVAIDISNRPCLVFHQDFPKDKVGNFDVELVEEFFTAFTSHARVTLHINIVKGKNTHHMIEACFKAFGIILDNASLISNRKKGIPSTKGVL